MPDAISDLSLSTHYHCPEGCDVWSKAQPFIADDTVYCGRCAAKHKRISVMVLCTPETCPDDFRRDS